jgi:hypothetical protein
MSNISRCQYEVIRYGNVADVTTFDDVCQDIDEDFHNALDVLRCFLREKNQNIIEELLDIYNRKTEYLASRKRPH